MKHPIRLFFALLILALVSIACNMDRILNPSQPTYTPSAPADAESTSIPPISTPTITPVPSPGARVESGDLFFFYGDWDRALFEFNQALSSSDPEVQAAALLGLGRTYYQTGNHAGALEALSNAIANYPNSSHRAAIFFALGEIYEALDRYDEAISAYQEYQALRPGLLDHLVLERIGDLHLLAGNYQAAIDTYQQAIQAPQLGDSLGINIKIGDAYVLLGDPGTALVIYQDVFNRTANDYIKAQMQRYVGYTSIQMGLTEQGYTAYRFAVENYPLAYDSYLALVALVEAGQPVDELSRGLVDYFAGQYAVASAAFERYLAANPENNVDTALFYNGLSLQATGQYQEAILEFDRIIDNHLNETFWADAFDEKAYTQWAYLGDYDGAIETLLTFVDRAPTHPDAPEFLFFAGRIAERNYDLYTAAQIWARLGMSYSTSAYGFDGFFQAGIAYYRLGDTTNAITQFQSALGVAGDNLEQSKAHFWIGKSYQLAGDQTNAFGAWQQAVGIDPTGYYSERARDIMEFREPFEPPPAYETNYDIVAERAEAEEWLRLVFSLPEDTDFTGMSVLQSDPRFARGTELWNLGLYNQARIEFESLRTAYSNDPLNSYKLANFYIDLGLYRSGIIAARQVLTLAGYDDAGTFRAPVYFNHLRFGLYFPELVFPAAEAYGFHPLFLYSVIRQESLFEGFVTSTAGARGLMQIIPSTGESIYNRSGWPSGYTAEDLYRPQVSVTYGADYMAAQRNAFGGDLLTALAAYNGGPGNAAAWRELAGGDVDLFVEVVRFSETRLYLRSIYELYTIYRNLYGAAQ